MNLGVPRAHVRPSLTSLIRLFGRFGRTCALLVLASAATAFAHIVITWDDNSSDEDGFIIERSDNGAAFQEIARTAANVTTFTDSTITVGVWYQYRVAAFNNGTGTSFYSNVATNAPTFITQPVSQAASAGQTVTFAVTTDGVTPITYQWSKDGQALSDSIGHIAGSTAATLVLTNVTNADLGSYTVVASNGVGPAATSNAAALTVQRATQTITFGALTAATFGDPSITLAATSSSGLPVSYTSSNPAVATIDGNILTVVGVGTTTITASQGGDGTFLAAANATQTLTVNKSPQTTAFDPISPATYGDAPIPLSATTSSGLPVTFVSLNTNIATVSGNVVTIVSAGTATLIARQAGNASFLAASDVSQTLTIAKKNHTITFTLPSTMVLGDPAYSPYTLTGTSDSGQPISYGTSQLSIAKVSGNSLSLVGSGTVDITASIPASTNYNAAAPVTRTVVVNKAPTFSTNPSTATVPAGFHVNFSVTVTAQPAATYQWQVSNTGGSSWADLSDNSTYTGSTTLTLGVNTTAALNGNLYRCVATNTVASTPSSAAVLNLTFAPAVTTQPANTFAPTGGSAIFTIGVNANPAPTYQWQMKSTAGGSTFVNLTNDGTYAGATSATLTVSGATAAFNQYQFRCVVTNSVNSTTSAAAILTVGNVAPAIYQDPAATSANAGTNATFNVAATGGPAPTFQWQMSTDGTHWNPISDGSLYTGTSTATLTVTAVPLSANATQYRAVATNSAGSATSAAATLTVNVNPAPQITTQPASQTVAAGNSVTFTVAATATIGNPNPTYQWQVSTNSGSSWTNVVASAIYSGVNSPTLTISDATGLNGYQFQCVVTSGVTSATSSAATLTVIANLAPSFTTQPDNATIPIGGNTSFTIAVVGTAPITLKWQVSTDGGTTWNDITAGAPYSGVTSATLQITGATSGMNAYQYRCVASNVAASGVTSTTATLAVVSTAPAFTSQPVSQTITAGGSTSFTATATGNPTPTYQWQVSTDGGTTWNFLTNGAPYSGATTSTLTITAAPQSLSGYKYQCVASNVAGPVSSNVATLTVNAASSGGGGGGGGGGGIIIPPPVNVAPTITTQPASLTISLNSSATFTVVAAGSPAPTYQWRFNGAAIFGATSASYTVASAQPIDAGNYDVVVTNSAGSVTSAKAVLTVAAAPTITTQPAGTTAALGATVTFSVTVAGQSPLTYQWRFNGAPIAGATAASYTIGTVQGSSAGTYDVVATNALGTATSDGAVLKVNTFAGEYFGTLSGGGTWALYIRPDNTGTYVAYLPDRKTAIVVTVTIDNTGAYQATGTELQAGSSTSAASDGAPRAASVATFTLSGTIQQGQVSGQLSGIGQSLTGAIDAGSGPSAGLYTAPAIASTGTTYSIVGPSGRTLLIVTGSTVDSVNGTINGSGQLSTTSAAGAQVNLSVDPNSSLLTTTYALTGAPTVKFSGVADTVPVTTRLTNLSARSPAGTGSSTLIAGFTVSGTGRKALLVRAVGPGLTTYGVANALGDPVLSLYSGQTLSATNDNWSTATNSADVATTASSLGAFALKSGSLDSALLTTVDPAGYTAQVTTTGTAGGVALVEIYDAAASTARLTNVSARAQVGTGDNVFIVSFVVAGNAPRQYLVRAIGPTLGTFGVTGALADPQLSIVRQDTKAQLAQNDDWSGTAALKTAFTSVGAFSLPDSSKDAAVVITLDPGSYSAIVSGTNNSTGIALIELYELP